MTLAALRYDRRGAVTLMMAFALMALIAGAAVAIDLGSLYLASRRLQGVADDAALAAATNPADAAAAAGRTVQANGLVAGVTATTGRYSADPALASAARFAAGGSAPDAVRVALTQDAPLFFARIFSSGATVRLAAGATAARIDYAAFSIGSRLASASGGLPGAILSAFAGTQLLLSVADYDSLARADVDVLAFSRALGTRAGVTAGGYADMLTATATLPQVASAIADTIAAAGGDTTAIAALRGLATRLPGTAVRLSDLVDPGVLAAQDHGDPANPIRIDAYSLLRETLMLSSGGRQVAIDLPAATGLASVRLYIAVGERPAHSPWLTVARDGSLVVRTAQSRLWLDANLAGAATLGLVSLRLPLYIELAQAQAKLAAIACPGGQANATVTLAVQPGIGSAAIADIDPAALTSFATPLVERQAQIAHALLFDVTGRAHVSIGGTTWQNVTFSRADIAAGTTRTVSTNDALQGVSASLVSGLSLTASAMGTGLPLPGVTQPIGAALALAAPAVDTILSQTLRTLGIGLGQADARVDGVRCGRPTLVF